MLAARYGHADAVQALLDAGADRYAEVRMTPCSLMTAHEIILSMGYCCGTRTVYGGVLQTSCDACTLLTVCNPAVAYRVHVRRKMTAGPR